MLLNLTQGNCRHINSITHEGKVVLVATDADGNIGYTIKQDGFEDSYLNQPAEQRTGWEDWQELELPFEEDDKSVVAKEKAELTYRGNTTDIYLLKSCYKTREESAVAPVQLVSGLGHLYVFRQSKSNTLLVDRFVLDGLTNTLTRKREVRFKRSKQKHKPNESQRRGSDGNLANIDSLDFTDINGKPFYEPTTELSLINNLANGWFSVVLLPTSEQDKYRWHVFAYNSATQKVELTTLRASEEGLFEVKDYTILDPEPRSIPGIIKRTLDLKNLAVAEGLTATRLAVAKGLTATRYDVQRERQTEDGMQLLRDSVQVMLAVGTSAGNVAAISFAVAADGTLSQIKDTPDTTNIRRNTPRQILLPLNTLDEIKAISQSNPPLQGTITSFARGEKDEVVLTSKQAAGLNEAEITQVKITGGKDCNCLYSQVTVIDENTFEITSERDIRGSWEVIPEEEFGLIYNGIVTAYQITQEGKLKVTALNHGLGNGDAVQVVNTKDYNGTYTVTKIDEETFSLDGSKWQPGTAISAKLQTKKRRGIIFDGVDDYIDLGDKVRVDRQFTQEVWIYPTITDTAYHGLLGNQPGTAGNKSRSPSIWVYQNKIATSFGDGKKDFTLLTDAAVLASNEWNHVAVTFDGNNCTIYVNGTLIKQGASSVNQLANTPIKYIGKVDNSFQGKVSEVRIWNICRTQEAITNSMYLQLTGREVGLVGYWRLDAIFEGNNERKVVDFSVDGNDGIVYGGAYVSCVTLKRNLIGTTTEAIKYENEELVAVSERAIYTEEFEFKTNNDVNPNNANENGDKIFTFAYKGKKNRSSQDWTTITAETTAFTNIGNNWYKASSRFTVPDGMSMLRSFGISDIKGSWTALEIRKHQIQLISNSITEQTYIDDIALKTFADNQIAAKEQLKQLAAKEQDYGLLLMQKRKLSYEISLLEDDTKLKSDTKSKSDQITKKESVIKRLFDYIEAEQKKLDAVKNLTVTFYKDKNYHHWLGSVGIGAYQASTHAWVVAITSLQVPEGLNVYLNDGSNFDGYVRHVGNNTARLEERINDKTRSFAISASNGITDINAKTAELAQKSRELASERNSLAILRAELVKLEELTGNTSSLLKTKKYDRSRIEEQLKGIDLSTTNQSFINGLSSNSKNCSMLPLKIDRRGLETRGALLGFVCPASRLSAIETCEGNVQLSYFDDQGRMPLTNFDATYDSTNPIGEQWILDSLRTCLNFDQSSSVVTLNSPISLGEEWTIEAWFTYPLPETGEWNTLTRGKNIDHHIIVKREANAEWLGIYSQVTFINSGYDLKYLSPGWHHLTAVAQGNDQAAKTTFYINGIKVGEANGKTTTGVHAIGNAQSGKQQFGKVAEVRIWGVALNAEEIAVNSKTLLTGNEPDLLAYYPFNEATGTIVENKVKDKDERNTRSHYCTIVDAMWWGCAAPIGNLGHQAVQFNGVNAYVEIDPSSIPTGNEITISFWAKGGISLPKTNSILEAKNAGGRILNIHLPWADQKVYFDCGTDRIEKLAQPREYQGTWVHWAFTKNAATGEMKIYLNGVLWHSGTGKTSNLSSTTQCYLGKAIFATDQCYEGSVADLRIWNKARTQAEIQADMNKRLTGKEAGLVGYWPLDHIVLASKGSQVLDLTANQKPGTVQGAILVSNQPLPIASDALVSSEYSTISQDRTAMMRRFFAAPTSQGVQLLPDKRVEELELQWIGNGQFAPTLLGYIEGPPPIPSENLTLEQGYNGATSVELALSEDVEFKWTRSQDSGLGYSVDLFAGSDVEQSFTTGIPGAEVTMKTLGVKAGFKGNLDFKYQFQNESSITSSSSLKMTDTLKLCGTQEQNAYFPHLGKRFIPKNIGYALVISALADVYVTRLKRSRKMIGYQVLPVENIPPDVNTITFLINPAYTMSGSLDGMTGSSATSQRFFKHVPEMRSQFGSLYPASYYRLQEAYDLKQKIEEQDKARESYFSQFNSRLVDEASLEQETNKGNAPGDISVNRPEDNPNGSLTPEEKKAEEDKKKKQLEDQTAAANTQQSVAVKKKQAKIDKLINDPNIHANATASFARWQEKMEDIQIRAGKRNIVNTYVWDADGGLRSESQSFANTAEHSIGGSFSLNAALGAQGNFSFGGGAQELTIQDTVNLTQTMKKTETRSKGIQLNVDVGGVENRGITDYNDYPIQPGEKVGRYRFMSFYLEGSTNHFNDFFSYVVDPEWLDSNSEEAHALRQAKAKANKTWRVLHRVTYVERPALMGFGRDLRQLPPTNSVNALGQLQTKVDQLEKQNAEMQLKLDAILKKLD